MNARPTLTIAQAGHTPGPWSASYSETSDGKDFWSIYGANDRAVTYMTLGPSRRLDANARLIAAAPEILDALEWIARPYGLLDQAVHHAPAGFTEDMLETGRIVRAAIAKARGAAA